MISKLYNWIHNFRNKLWLKMEIKLWTVKIGDHSTKRSPINIVNHFQITSVDII